MSSQKVMIIAGEASGDLHGANLVKALKNRRPGLRLFGMGGQRLKAAGMSILLDFEQLSVVGLTEVITRLPQVFHAISIIKTALRKERPDLLILIDFPEFNLHIAAAAKKLSIPVLFYISPQIWAWRSGRVRKIKRRIDHMAVILPFEDRFYRKHKVPVTFVGHPLMDEAAAEDPNPAAATDDEGRKRIALFPGSRSKEVSELLPVMIQSALCLKRKMPDLKFIISCAPSIQRGRIEEILALHGQGGDFEILNQEAAVIFKKSRLALVKSGTVTLQAAIYDTPAIIIYKLSPLSYFLGRRLIRVEHIGLANLIAGKRVFPELIQADANPELICSTAHHMLTETHGFENLKSELKKIRQRLGQPGASDRVAQLALTLLALKTRDASSHSEPIAPSCHS